MSMAMMVAMASRKRDERGRYSEGEEMRRMEGDRYMGNDHSTHMGGYGREMTDMPEMRRRRDDRGRYMGGGDDNRSAWREPHILPYMQPERRRMEDNPYQMRDSNVIHIRDYQDRRHIGFASRDDEEDRDMRQYGRRYDPDRPQMHHGMMQESRQRMGGAEGADGEHLSREEAEKWVNSMQGADGKRGGRWTLKEIEQYAGNFGVHGDEVVEFFAVLNALYTDYGKVARKYGFDRMEVWADLAKAFMHDKDAEPGKVKMYYECITKKDE